MTKLEKKRSELIELLGVFVEQERSIAPLAARIYSSLIINGREGTTFEQLVNSLNASKSSISTHLNTLVAQKAIIYFTKRGDRKRYYRVTPGYIHRKIDKYIFQWEQEIRLQKSIIDFKKHFINDNQNIEADLEVHNEILEFLTVSVDTFTKLKPNFNIKENVSI